MEWEIKRDCVFYNWGGDPRLGYTYYPRRYGARCEVNDQFFEDGKGKAIPDCVGCIYYCHRSYVERV